MKRRFMVMLLCGSMVMASLTACGGSDADISEEDIEAEEEDAEEYVESEEEDTLEDLAAETEDLAAQTEETMSDEMCSDEDFAAVQSAYEAVSQQFDLIYQYSVADGFLDSEGEANMQYLRDTIDQYKDLDQSTMTTQDAIDAAQGLADMANILSEMANEIVQ